MEVIAVDPGYEQSAWVLWDGSRVQKHWIEPNVDVFTMLYGIGRSVDAIVFEQIESFGMAVGREIFETVFWTGRFFEAATPPAFERTPLVERMTRKTVKLHLCGSARAQDTNIRTALMDRFGGKEKAIGKKKTPGPLFGIKSHEWSALAIAVTWADLHASAPTERTVHVQQA